MSPPASPLLPSTRRARFDGALRADRGLAPPGTLRGMLGGGEQVRQFARQDDNGSLWIIGVPRGGHLWNLHCEPPAEGGARPRSARPRAISRHLDPHRRRARHHRRRLVPSPLAERGWNRRLRPIGGLRAADVRRRWVLPRQSMGPDQRSTVAAARAGVRTGTRASSPKHPAGQATAASASPIARRTVSWLTPKSAATSRRDRPRATATRAASRCATESLPERSCWRVAP